MDKIKEMEYEYADLRYQRQTAVHTLTSLFNEQDKLNKDKRNLEQEIKGHMDRIDHMKLNMAYGTVEQINKVLQRLEYEFKHHRNSKWEQKRLQDEIQTLKKNRDDLPNLSRREARLVQKRAELEDKAKDYTNLQARIAEQRDIRNRLTQQLSIIETQLRAIRTALGVPPNRPTFINNRNSWGSPSIVSVSPSPSESPTTVPMLASPPQPDLVPRPTSFPSTSDVQSEGTSSGSLETTVAFSEDATTPTPCATSRSMAQMVANWSLSAGSSMDRPPGPPPQLQPLSKSSMTPTTSTAPSKQTPLMTPSTSSASHQKHIEQQIRRQQSQQRQAKLFSLSERRRQAQKDSQRCEELLAYFQNSINTRQRGRSRASRRLPLPMDVCCSLQKFNVIIPSGVEQVNEIVIPRLQELLTMFQDRATDFQQRLEHYLLDNEGYTSGSNLLFNSRLLDRVNSVDGVSTITDSAFSEQSVSLANPPRPATCGDVEEASGAVVTPLDAAPDEGSDMIALPTLDSHTSILAADLPREGEEDTASGFQLRSGSAPKEDDMNNTKILLSSRSSSVYCSADELERSESVSPCTDALMRSGNTLRFSSGASCSPPLDKENSSTTTTEDPLVAANRALESQQREFGHRLRRQSSG